MKNYKKEALEDFIDDFEEVLDDFEDSTKYLREDMKGRHREVFLTIMRDKLNALKKAKKSKDVSEVADMDNILDTYGDDE